MITQEAAYSTLDAFLDAYPYCKARLSASVSSTSILAHIQNEPEEAAGEYEPQDYTAAITAGSSLSDQESVTWSATSDTYQANFAFFEFFAAAGKPTGNVPFLASALDTVNDRVQVTGHGLTDGDRIALSADAGGTLPAEILATQFYYAGVVDANNFELYEEPALSTQVAFSAGSGTLRLRYAVGVFYGDYAVGTTATIQSGIPLTLPNHQFRATLSGGSFLAVE